jgi:protease-4
MGENLRKLLWSAAGTVLGLIVFIVIVAGFAIWRLDAKPDIEDRSWLVVDLYGPVHEYHPPGGVMGEALGGDAVILQEVLDGLAKAALDDRIEGVILKLSSSNDAGWAKLQEMREAVDRLQAAGKPVHAWGDALDLKTLYLAGACDDVAMPAGGFFEFTGLSTESLHLRGLLDKLGVVPHLHKIEDYKAAAEMVMNEEMSPAVREMRTWMLEDAWDQVVPVLAAERGLTVERVEELMAYAQFLPREAAEAGLIDEVIYWQELEERLKPADADVLPVVTLCDYAEVSFADLGHEGEETVAVVHAQGTIGGRENGVDPLLGIMMGHETMVRELRRCREDDEVAGVVLRVDSGGGEGLASDLIAHEVELLAEVKPVVVSMVDVAGSGGYYIAYKATEILADPLTRTGSIGSINGFFNLRGLYDRLGVSKDFVSRGPMARLGTDYRDPTPEEWERHVDAHYKTFDTWMYDVAEERGIPRDRIADLALGRVWTGRQAAGNGLVDRTGDLHAAVRLAAELAGIPPETELAVVHLPERKDLLESLVGGDPGLDDPVAIAVSWQLHRTLHRDLAATLRRLESGAVDPRR